MIRVTIELVPYGDEARAEVLHEILIANDGSGTLARGNYAASLTRRSSAAVWKTARVDDFPRQRKNAYHLLKAVLDQVIS